MLIQTILKLKESQNLTYRSLGKKLGFSHTWLNEVVNGRKEPNLDLLRAVSLVTGKGYDELIKKIGQEGCSKKIAQDLLEHY